MSLSAKEVTELRDERVFEPPPASNIYSRSTSYVGKHTRHKARIRLLDAIIDNRPEMVWPDLLPDTQMQARARIPVIGNPIRRDIEDMGKLAGGTEPTTIVDALRPTDKAQAAATLLVQVLASYRRRNRTKRLRKKTATDLAKAGLSCWVIWPDYDEGFPRYVRRDPRDIYPDPGWRDGEDLRDLICSYTVKARELEELHPGVMSELFTLAERRDAGKRDVDVVEFYDKNVSMKVAGIKRTPGSSATTLMALENRIGKPLAIIGTRLSADEEFRGQFDDALAPLGVANQMLVMMLDDMINQIYAQPWFKGRWDNLDEFGTGAALHTDDPVAEAGRIEPSHSNPQLFAHSQQLLQNARMTTGIPETRQGQAEQSIISARGIEALQGGLLTQVDDYLDTMADVEERANSLALAVDEMYLGYPAYVKVGDKWEGRGEPIRRNVSGMNAGANFSVSYTAKDIAERYDNRVVYGEGSGFDSYNRTAHVGQIVNFGFRSKRWGRMQIQGDVDVQDDEAQMFREQLEAGLTAQLQQPGAIPPQALVQAMKLLDTKGIAEAMEFLYGTATPAEAPAEEPMMDPMVQQDAMRKGGIPGKAKTLRALPSLGDLRAG